MMDEYYEIKVNTHFHKKVNTHFHKKPIKTKVESLVLQLYQCYKQNMHTITYGNIIKIHDMHKHTKLRLTKYNKIFK